jgi:hypothetical protein
MIFITEKRPDLPIYSGRLGYTIRFEGGRYETDDRAEIAVLRRHPLVVNFTEVEQELTAPSPLDQSAPPAPPEPPIENSWSRPPDDPEDDDADRSPAH